MFDDVLKPGLKTLIQHVFNPGSCERPLYRVPLYETTIIQMPVLNVLWKKAFM